MCKGTEARLTKAVNIRAPPHFQDASLPKLLSSDGRAWCEAVPAHLCKPISCFTTTSHTGSSCPWMIINMIASELLPLLFLFSGTFFPICSHGWPLPHSSDLTSSVRPSRAISPEARPLPFLLTAHVTWNALWPVIFPLLTCLLPARCSGM